MADHRDRQVGRGLLVAERDQVGRVVAGVVADDELGDTLVEFLRDAVQDACERGHGVVGDDENADARLGLALGAWALA